MNIITLVFTFILHINLVLIVFFLDLDKRQYSSPSFLLLRNAFDSYSDFQQQMIILCRCFKTSNSIKYYSLELFDRFYTNLISNGRDVGLLDSLPYTIKLTPQFGLTIESLTNLELRYDRLYAAVVNDSHFIPHARIVCMAVCIFIASKQFECQHLLLSKVKSVLYNFDIPSVWCRLEFLVKIERKILSILKFQLNITPLNTYIETVMILLSRCFTVTYPKLYKHTLIPEKVGQMQLISQKLMENFYILRVPFGVNLFKVFHEREINFYILRDIEAVENIYRDKILISAIIVAAACLLVFGHSSVKRDILTFLANICQTDLNWIDRGSHLALKYLFVNLNEKLNSY